MYSVQCTLYTVHCTLPTSNHYISHMLTRYPLQTHFRTISPTTSYPTTPTQRPLYLPPTLRIPTTPYPRLLHNIPYDQHLLSEHLPPLPLPLTPTQYPLRPTPPTLTPNSYTISLTTNIYSQNTYHPYPYPQLLHNVSYDQHLLPLPLTPTQYPLRPTSTLRTLTTPTLTPTPTQCLLRPTPPTLTPNSYTLSLMTNTSYPYPQLLHNIPYDKHLLPLPPTPTQYPLRQTPPTLTPHSYIMPHTTNTPYPYPQLLHNVLYDQHLLPLPPNSYTISLTTNIYSQNTSYPYPHSYTISLMTNTSYPYPQLLHNIPYDQHLLSEHLPSLPLPPTPTQCLIRPTPPTLTPNSYTMSLTTNTSYPYPQLLHNASYDQHLLPLPPTPTQCPLRPTPPTLTPDSYTISLTTNIYSQNTYHPYPYPRLLHNLPYDQHLLSEHLPLLPLPPTPTQYPLRPTPPTLTPNSYTMPHTTNTSYPYPHSYTISLTTNIYSQNTYHPYPYPRLLHNLPYDQHLLSEHLPLLPLPPTPTQCPLRPTPPTLTPNSYTMPHTTNTSYPYPQLLHNAPYDQHLLPLPPTPTQYPLRPTSTLRTLTIPTLTPDSYTISLTTNIYSQNTYHSYPYPQLLHNIPYDQHLLPLPPTPTQCLIRPTPPTLTPTPTQSPLRPTSTLRTLTTPTLTPNSYTISLTTNIYSQNTSYPYPQLLHNIPYDQHLLSEHDLSQLPPSHCGSLFGSRNRSHLGYSPSQRISESQMFLLCSARWTSQVIYQI